MRLGNAASAIVLAGTWIASTASAAHAQADQCPPPIVQRMHGPVGGEMAKEVALNATVELNRHSVRFVEFLPSRSFSGPVGDEYTLTGEQSDGGVRLTLADPKGRLVTSSSAEIEGAYEVEAGRLAAERISPLLPRIRAHQRRVREEERSAIHARLVVAPNDATVGVDETLDLELELIDCDDTPLSREPVGHEHDGVGRVQPARLATDAEGRATLSFVSSQTGNASVVGYWRYENTEGVPVVALPEAPSAITVEDDRWRLTATVTAEGDMTTTGTWDGTFRVVDGDRIRGDGTITTTVVGSCVSGTARTPMRISGHRSGETMYVTVVGEDDGSEPDTRIEESMECVVKTLIELPSFFAGLAKFAEMMVMNDPCPLRVPTGAGATTAECSGVSFRVTPMGGS